MTDTDICVKVTGENMRALIVSGGTLDDNQVCSMIKNDGFDVIYAADAGMEALYRHHLTPDIIVGDFDSVCEEALSYFKRSGRVELVELTPEKDDTDTEHAIRDAISRGFDHIVLVGATGTRLDHVLANISLLGIGLEEGITMEMVDAHNRIRMVNGPISMEKESQFGKYVSLIPYSEVVENLTLEGFKYELNGYPLTGFNSLGVSNEIVADVAHINFSKGILLVIESRD